MEEIQTSSKLGMWKVYQQKVHERDHTFFVKNGIYNPKELDFGAKIPM